MAELDQDAGPLGTGVRHVVHEVGDVPETTHTHRSRCGSTLKQHTLTGQDVVQH